MSGRIKQPKGKVSTIPPQAEAEKVCFTRPARSQRRTYSPTDLKRIYKYVIGSHGFAPATCALLEASGIEDMLGASAAEVQAQDLCSFSLDLSAYSQYIPEGSDEVLGLPPGTLSTAAQGCVEGDDWLSIGQQIRAALIILILVWGLWRRVTASRLYRFVIRRILVLFVLFEVLEQAEEFVARLIPVLLVITDSLGAIGEICDQVGD